MFHWKDERRIRRVSTNHNARFAGNQLPSPCTRRRGRLIDRDSPWLQYSVDLCRILQEIVHCFIAALPRSFPVPGVILRSKVRLSLHHKVQWGESGGVTIRQAQVCSTQVCSTQVCFPKDRLEETRQRKKWFDLRILFLPLTPCLDSFPKPREMFGIRHGASEEFGGLF
jgi:hypothetical protein